MALRDESATFVSKVSHARVAHSWTSAPEGRSGPHRKDLATPNEPRRVYQTLIFFPRAIAFEDEQVSA